MVDEGKSVKENIMMYRIVLLTVLVLMFAPSVSAEKVQSFQVVLGVSLGPVVLDMSFARALKAMPEEPDRVDQQQARLEDGTITTRQEIEWIRVKEKGEGSLNVFLSAKFKDGKMYLLNGDDDRLAYRGKNLYDLSFADLIQYLGVPEGIYPRSAAYIWLVWDTKGVAFLIVSNENEEWFAASVAVFPKNTWDEI